MPGKPRQLLPHTCDHKTLQTRPSQLAAPGVKDGLSPVHPGVVDDAVHQRTPSHRDVPQPYATPVLQSVFTK